MAKTHGDVFKVYVTPPANSFPWVKVFLHEEGIRKAGREVGGVNAPRDPDDLALQIGREIIKHSKVLTAWLAPTHPERE